MSESEEIISGFVPLEMNNRLCRMASRKQTPAFGSMVQRAVFLEFSKTVGELDKLAPDRTEHVGSDEAPPRTSPCDEGVTYVCTDPVLRSVRAMGDTLRHGVHTEEPAGMAKRDELTSRRWTLSHLRRRRDWRHGSPACASDGRLHGPDRRRKKRKARRPEGRRALKLLELGDPRRSGGRSGRWCGPGSTRWSSGSCRRRS